MPNRPAVRPHIVMVSGHAPPVMDGVGDCTAPLIGELARQRPEWRWSWLTRRPGWNRSPWVQRNGYSLYRINHTWSRRGISAACLALKWLNPSLLHIQDQIHSYFETDAAVQLAKATHAPVITTLHEYHIELPSVSITDALIRQSTVIIANDSRNADRCLERIGRTVDLRGWSGSTVAPIPRHPEADLVMTFGFITALKSVDAPLSALKSLRDNGYPLRWKIVGPFNPESNPEHAKMAGLGSQDWLEFTGGFSVQDPRLQHLLASARVMILPYADGASLRRTTLHAAWAFGIPVITTPPPSPEPAIIDGDNCLLVDGTNPDEWERALKRILTDPELEARLSAGGLATADAYGWPALARRHLTLYDRLIARQQEVATS